MEKIEKLLRKVNRADRERLLDIMSRLAKNKTHGMNVQKIKGTDLYRMRQGRFRIIFHRDEHTEETVIDNIRLRREDTYKNL